jgi:hypothetical protein
MENIPDTDALSRVFEERKREVEAIDGFEIEKSTA